MKPVNAYSLDNSLLCTEILILFNHFKVVQMKYRKGKFTLLLTKANL